jgi:hypothetical protein
VRAQLPLEAPDRLELGSSIFRQPRVVQCEGRMSDELLDHRHHPSTHPRGRPSTLQGHGAQRVTAFTEQRHHQEVPSPRKESGQSRVRRRVDLAHQAGGPIGPNAFDERVESRGQVVERSFVGRGQHTEVAFRRGEHDSSCESEGRTQLFHQDGGDLLGPSAGIDPSHHRREGCQIDLLPSELPLARGGGGGGGEREEPQRRYRECHRDTTGSTFGERR